VILKPGTRIIGIDDSKKLDATAREELESEIREKAEVGVSPSSRSKRSTRSTSIGRATVRTLGMLPTKMRQRANFDM
jgi:ribonuclease HII